MALEQRSLHELRLSVDGQLDIDRLDYQDYLVNTIESNLKLVTTARDQRDVTRARLAAHIDPLKVNLGRVPTRADLTTEFIRIDTKEVLDSAAIEEYDKGELEKFAAIFDTSLGLIDVAHSTLVVHAFKNGTYRAGLEQDPECTPEQRLKLYSQAEELARHFKKDHSGLTTYNAARDYLIADISANSDSLYLRDFVIAGTGLAVAMHRVVHPLTRGLVTPPQHKVSL